jgi:hypothetical protein
MTCVSMLALPTKRAASTTIAVPSERLTMPPSIRSSSRLAVRTCVLTVSFALATIFACSSPSEGERCNIDLSHNECASNLACTVPTNCAYAVCCPTSGASTNPACNPCAGEDAGDVTPTEDAAPAEDAAPTEDADAADGG